MTKLINTQFQLVWSIFLELPPFRTKTDLAEVNASLEDKKVLQPSMDRTLKSWIDGTDADSAPLISSKTFSLNGLAVSEMRTYAQKKKKDKKYHRSFFDEVTLKQEGRLLALNYTFEIISLSPNIFLIDVKTQTFKADLYIDDFKRLAYMPKSDIKSNLYFYVKRLCRFIADWNNSDLFNQRQEIENDLSISVIPTIIIDFEEEKQLRHFRTQQKREMYGILTRAANWDSIVLSRVEDVVSKNLSSYKDDVLLISKTGILIADQVTQNLETRHWEYFSILKLMEVAYAHGLMLDTATRVKKPPKDFIESICDNILHPIRITKSSYLREIWETSLANEFSLITKCEYAKNVNGKEEMSKEMKTSPNNSPSKSNKDLLFKLLTSIVLLSFALAGFIWLPWLTAILWLIFLIVAYPVALAFTTAKQSMNNKGLIEIYKNGLLQVPVIGKFFEKKYLP